MRDTAPSTLDVSSLLSYTDDSLLHEPEHALCAAVTLSALSTFPLSHQLQIWREAIFRTVVSNVQASYDTPETLLISLVAATQYRPEGLDGQTLAHIIKGFLKLELAPGGPYALAGTADPGVNAAIATFLLTQDIRLPQLDTYLASCITRGDTSSRLFSPTISAYLFAVSCPATLRPTLANHLHTLSRNAADTPSRALLALAFDAMHYAPAEYPALFQALTTAPFGTAMHTDTTSLLPCCDTHGPLVTTAMSLAARHRIRVHGTRDPQVVRQAYLEARAAQLEEKALARISEAAATRFAHLGDDLREVALREITRTLTNNTDRQMSLMPYYFRTALGVKGHAFSDDIIARLGLANVFFWTAFIIYDDFWDEDEAAIPEILPAANLYAREFTLFYSRILPNRGDFHAFFDALMDRVDAANTWETRHCRATVQNNVLAVPNVLPDFDEYTRKYEPASAHILGCVAMLCQLGYAIESPEVRNLTAYFKNYLIPMQLNDDLHDWEEDLARGNLSTVVTMLLEDYGAKPGDLIHLHNDLQKLRETYWFTTLPRACARIRPFLARARAALAALPVITELHPLEKFILRIERSIAAAEAEQATSTAFLAAYRTPSK